MPPAACVVEGAAGSVGELTALLSYVFGAVILAATINVVAGIVTS